MNEIIEWIEWIYRFWVKWRALCNLKKKRRGKKYCELNVNCMNEWMNSNLALYWIMMMMMMIEMGEWKGLDCMDGYLRKKLTKKIVCFHFVFILFYKRPNNSFSRDFHFLSFPLIWVFTKKKVCFSEQFLDFVTFHPIDVCFYETYTNQIMTKRIEFLTFEYQRTKQIFFYFYRKFPVSLNRLRNSLLMEYIYSKN